MLFPGRPIRSGSAATQDGIANANHRYGNLTIVDGDHAAVLIPLGRWVEIERFPHTTGLLDYWCNRDIMPTIPLVTPNSTAFIDLRMLPP